MTDADDAQRRIVIADELSEFLKLRRGEAEKFTD